MHLTGRFPQIILTIILLIAFTVLISEKIKAINPGQYFSSRKLTFIPTVERTKSKVLIKNINQSIIPFHDLAKANNDSAYTIDEQNLKNYHHYYTNIISVFPKMAEAYGILGFISYYEGDLESAVEHLLKANYLDADFYWPSYNLALIYYQAGKYDRVETVLEQNLNLNIINSVNKMMNSKIYQQILSSDQTKIDLLKNIKSGYQNAIFLMAISKINLEKYEEAISIIQKARLSGFDHDYMLNYLLGFIYYRLGNFADCHQQMNSAVQHIDFTEVNFYNAACLQKIGEEEQAKYFLQKANKMKLSLSEYLLQSYNWRLKIY